MAYAPPNGPAGDKNAYQRSIIRIIRPINGSFVSRMQYAPTQGHENAVRFVYTTTMQQSNAVRFSYPTPWHSPTAPRLRHAPMWDGEDGKILSLVTSEKSILLLSFATQKRAITDTFIEV